MSAAGEQRNPQVVVTRHGGAEVLELRTAAVPTPGRCEVHVAVLTSGLSFVDVLIRAGTSPRAPKLPFVSGYNFIGQVDVCGSDATSLHPGDLVAGLPVTGALTRFFVSPEHEVVFLPVGSDPIVCACLPLNYMTAFQMPTHTVSLRPGDPVLVHGATGVVGTAMLDLGRSMGLRLIGTRSRARGDRGRVWSHLRRPRGLRSGAAGTRAVWRRRRVMRCEIAKWKQRHPDWHRADLLHLVELVRQGSIAPQVARSLPFTQTRQAHALLDQGGVVGTMVVQVAPDAGEP